MHRTPRRRFVLVALLSTLLTAAALSACAGGDGGDGGADAALPDAGLPDVGLPDVGQPDGGDAPDSADPDSGGTPDVDGDVDGDVAGHDAGPDADEPPLEPLDAETAAALQGILDEYLAFSGDPGVTLAVRTGEGRWWAGASGVADLRDDALLAAGSGFRVGSNTKPFIATVVLQLAEEGRVGLDDPITDYLPQYGDWSDTTLRHLLHMQSGIPDYLTQPDLMLAVATDPTHALTPSELVASVEDDARLFAPGEGCVYSNTNYVLLGMVIEEVTGNPVEQELDDRVVAPLGLSNTWLDTSGDVQPGLAHGYMDLAIVAQMFGVPAALLDLIPQEHFVDATTIDVTYVFHPSVSWAAGALVSSAEDMVRFMRALLRGELLGPEMLAEMKDVGDCTILDSPAAYGLGMTSHETAYGTAWGHGGLNFGYQASTFHLPDRDLTFSHMHDFLPEQSWILEWEMLRAVLEGPPAEGSTDPCTPPDGLFEGDDGPYLMLRFKGLVNAQGAARPLPGLAQIRQVTGDDAIPLYGMYTMAQRKQQGLSARVEVTSYAPSIEAGVDLRYAVVSIAPSFLARIDDGGAHTLSNQDIASLIGLVAAVDLDEQTNEATRLCFTAVPDMTRPSRAAACEAASFTGQVGDGLKLFAALALTTDPARVEQTLAAFQLPPCLCPDATGEWGACP